jgi:SHS2 domain-containing protein
VKQDRGHRQVDHAADLALEFWAPTEAELLVQGAQALVEVLTDGAGIARQSSREIALSTVDAEDRLVQWLNEVLLLATVDGFVLADAELHLHDGGLRGSIIGQPGAHSLIEVELKSVTYHALALRHEQGRHSGHVVIDV